MLKEKPSSSLLGPKFQDHSDKMEKRQHSLSCSSLSERRWAEHLRATAACRGEKRSLGQRKQKHTLHSAWCTEDKLQGQIPFVRVHTSVCTAFKFPAVPTAQTEAPTECCCCWRRTVSGRPLPKEAHKLELTPCHSSASAPS